jgi:hypothetical protein
MTAPKRKVAPRDARWFLRLRAAQRARDAVAVEWARNRRLLVGPDQGSITGSVLTDVYLAWAGFQTIVGSVYGQIPKIVVKETQEQDELAARVLNGVVPHDFDVMRMREVSHAAINDAWWAGHGFIMEKLCNDITSMLFRFSDDTEGKMPAIAGQRYDVFRLHPETVLLDPVAAEPDLSDAGWMSMDYYPTVKELRDNEYYDIPKDILDSLPRLQVAPMLTPNSVLNASVGPFGTATTPDDEDPEHAKVACREVWDRVSREIRYIPKGTDFVIGKRDWPVDLRFNGVRRFPVTPLYFSRHPQRLYGIPEMSMVAPQIEQFQFLFRQVIRDAATKWRKFVAVGLPAQQLNKLVAGKPNEVVEIPKRDINMETVDVRKLILPVPDLAMKQDVLAVMTMVKGIVHELLGAGDFASGGFRNTRSATEAAALADFMRLRASPRTEAIDTFHRHAAITHVLFLQETLVKPRGVSILGTDGTEIWQTYNRSRIQGDFVFRVTAGSSMPENTEVARQEALAFFQQAIGIVQAAGGDPEPFIRWIAPYHRMPDHVVDQIFRHHKAALGELAQLFAAVHAGQLDPAAASKALLEVAAKVIQTGLTAPEIQALTEPVAAAAGGGAAKAQPGGLPGTNTSDQLM